MNDLNIPTELVSRPFEDWQLNLTTLFVAAMLLGRAYASIRAGGGIVGIWKSLLYGYTYPHESKPSMPLAPGIEEAKQESLASVPGNVGAVDSHSNDHHYHSHSHTSP